ncbi:MAG: hypothetical protein LC778_10385 [Acidobacteria bacterium]|nr:hypothetical protein [Acidobacteriota bacterium]
MTTSELPQSYTVITWAALLAISPVEGLLGMRYVLRVALSADPKQLGDKDIRDLQKAINDIDIQLSLLTNFAPETVRELESRLFSSPPQE